MSSKAAEVSDSAGGARGQLSPQPSALGPRPWRLAVLSDVHGNLLALEAVLADLEARGGADALVVAGDLCLDGPLPREALERVRALGCPVVQGNTDRDLAAASGGEDDDQAALLAWTRELQGDDRLAYLRDLPFSHQVAPPDGGPAVLIVHANPKNLDDHLRPLAPEEEVAPPLAGVPDGVAVLAFGHLHIPYTRRVGRLLLADIASVGLPKDGDRRAAYGVLTWTDGEWTVELRRVEYPVDEVVAQLRAANPPGVANLVRTLLRARYPDMAKARGGPAPRAPRPRKTAPDSPPPAGGPPSQRRPTATQRHANHSPVSPAGGSIHGCAARWSSALPFPMLGEGGGAERGTERGEGAATERRAEGSEAGAREGRPRRKRARPKPKADAPQLDPHEPFALAVRDLIAGRLAVLLAQEPGVRAGEDPEAVHQMRVASRRLRAALDAAEPVGKRKPHGRLSRRVKELTHALGAVRDRDVLLAGLRKRRKRAPDEERAGIAALIDRVGAAREPERAALLATLDRWRDDDIAGNFARFLAGLGQDLPGEIAHGGGTDGEEAEEGRPQGH